MKIKLLSIIIIQLLLLSSCQNDILEDIDSLNSDGKQFMELLTTYENWQSDWNKVEDLGEPLPNEATMIFTFPHNGYYIVPVLNNNEITCIALYPILMKNENRLTTTSPVIIGKEEAKENIWIQNLLETQVFKTWQEKGYLQNFEKNDRVPEEHISLSRHGMSAINHMFCFSMIINIYTTSSNDYNACLNDLRRHMEAFIKKMR